jgi:hypothetical protein
MGGGVLREGAAAIAKRDGANLETWRKYQMARVDPEHPPPRTLIGVKSGKTKIAG